MKDMIALHEQLTIERDGWWAVRDALMRQQGREWLSVVLDDTSHRINHVSKRIEIVELAIRLASEDNHNA